MPAKGRRTPRGRPSGKKPQPEWHFDETTPPESNRVVPPDPQACERCGHQHRNRTAHPSMGGIVRCWVPIPQEGHRALYCKCRGPTEEGASQPVWAHGIRKTTCQHLWWVDSRPTELVFAWAYCGLEIRGAPRLHVASGATGERCAICERGRPPGVEAVTAAQGATVLPAADRGSRIAGLHQQLFWAQQRYVADPGSAQTLEAYLRALSKLIIEMRWVLSILERHRNEFR